MARILGEHYPNHRLTESPIVFIRILPAWGAYFIGCDVGSRVKLQMLEVTNLEACYLHLKSGPCYTLDASDRAIAPPASTVNRLVVR